ncbi:MAG: glycosyl transferase family A, partial [Cyanobium sp. RS427]|nr:glycosyl transferase family A [Cyanobium sp. RS427]
MASSIGLLILQIGLRRVFALAPQLQDPVEEPLSETSLTVVIPAYNEA